MPVVLISGANRGLGLGLATAYAALADHTVIAAVRKPEFMPKLDTASGSKLVVVKLDSGVIDDAKAVVQELKEKHGITQIDITIANAAIMTEKITGKLSVVDLSAFDEHYKVNVVGPLALFQAVRPVIPSGGKFIWMSSGASIIDRVPDKTDAGYGITKSAMNYLGRYSHFEEPDIVTFSLSPGWVQTDMGNFAAKSAGLEQAPTTLKESVDGMVKVIADANRDNYAGLHMRYNGTQSKW